MYRCFKGSRLTLYIARRQPEDTVTVSAAVRGVWEVAVPRSDKIFPLEQLSEASAMFNKFGTTMSGA